MSLKDEALADSIWQDREVRFDLDPRLLHLIPGEYLVSRINGAEDSKGNNGDKGILRVTNLRLIWYANTASRINLSIGYGTINGVTTKLAKSKLRGNAESLYLMAHFAKTRFEFIFTCIDPSQTKLFTTVISIHRAYETTKLYRLLKMRGAIINNEQQLRILPNEQQCDRFDGVWNLSNDHGTLGTMILTNIRIVWFCTTSNSYNVSIPYFQVHISRIRNSRFGPVLVIETSTVSGEYLLGFRVDPQEKLDIINRSINALKNAFCLKPLFGVQFSREKSGSPQPVGELIKQKTEEDIEVDDRPLRPDAYAAYFADGFVSGQVRPPTYSPELGVAIEQLKDGFTLADLWKIHVD
ncbi:unnamed protein product [Thelazia callipaeda]|uniref:Bardet-Biedl syndrome 5 protein homolog n=1 Tax=Thelazia callipaeda TaxID=103827 RepID=A0A0N5D3Y0_THECL|nr:unnamed protein product [Thelazia callipaeda]